MNLGLKLKGTEKVQIYPTKVKESTLVSVCVQTYKHENYIKQCLDGILMQKTNFEFEILLGEDDSPDRTREICIEYADKYPNKIRLFLHDRSNVIYINGNATGRYNFIYNLTNAKSKYIALCPGDDYWTDPLKLKKQVNFLEKNDDVNIVHTEIDWLNEQDHHIIKNYYKSINYYLPEIYDINHFYLNSKMRTLTFCFRSKCMEGFSDLLLKNSWTVGDTALVLYITKNKKIGFIDDCTGVYRRGNETASISKNPSKQFNYWKNASSKVKYFFYDYYNLDNKNIKNKLDNDYYDNMFNVAIPAKKFKYIAKSFIYKLFKLRLTKTNIGQLYYGLIVNKKKRIKNLLNYFFIM